MAIADVQSPVTFIDTADNAVNKTIALGSNVTLGSLLLLIVSAVGHNVGSCTVSDSLGNTWTSVQGDAFWAGSSHGVGFFVAKVATAGACTVTLNKNGATTSIAMELSEISGWDGTNALDGVTVIDTGNDATAPLTMNATSVADDFLFTAICGDPASAFTPGSPASGFTARSSLNNEATFNQLKTASRKPGATGTYSAGWPAMTNAGSNGWAVVAFAIKGQASGSSTTVTPGVGSVTVNGRAPSTSAFQNVRIREVLVNSSGQVVGNATDIGLRVWYSGICAGAPDVSLNGMTTDANGTTSWSIATGGLSFNQPIFYVAQNSVSYASYTAARMTPSYE